MPKTKKASVLVYSLLILSIMLVIAISISSVSTKNMQGTMTSNKSTQAFQTADSGMEVMMKKIKDVEDREITIDTFDRTCSGDKIVLTSNEVGQGTAEIAFFNKDGVRLNCSDELSKVEEIKSIGSYGETVRAVRMKVAKEGSATSEFSCTGTEPSESDKCTGAEEGLSVDKAWHKVSDCDTASTEDKKCGYEDTVAPSGCSGGTPGNSAKCADNGSIAWHNVSTCTGATCGYVCNPGFTYSGGSCIPSGGGGTPVCTSFTTGAWGACMDPSAIQTRTVTGVPAGCTGGTPPASSQSCGTTLALTIGPGGKSMFASNFSVFPNGTGAGGSIFKFQASKGNPTSGTTYNWYDQVGDGPYHFYAKADGPSTTYVATIIDNAASTNVDASYPYKYLPAAFSVSNVTIGKNWTEIPVSVNLDMIKSQGYYDGRGYWAYAILRLKFDGASHYSEYTLDVRGVIP